MTPNEQLYDKLSAEFDAYVAGLKKLPPEKIIDSAYEKVFKEDILMSFESSYYGDAECAALLALDSPLDELYRNWLDTDVSYMDDLSDTISGFIVREMERGKDVERATVTDFATVMPEPDPSTLPVMAINGELYIGDWVLVKPDETYGCLIGQVKAIEKLGTEEHDTENVTDDVHVDFTAIEYTGLAKAELLEAFDRLYPDAQTFDEIPLDDVIMAPESLISLVGLDFERVGELSGSYKAAYEAANKILSEYFSGLEAKLIDRVEQNYADYQQTLTSFGANELIDMAAKIHATSDAYSYMTSYHGYSDDETRFYLQFSNPLEVVADAWHERNIDLDEMSFTMDFISEHRDTFLTQYALAADEPSDTGLRRFMGVNLFNFLGKIAEQTIIHYPNDWQYDRDALWNAAQSDNTEDKRVVWHVCSYSTHLKNERDVFVRDSGAYAYMTDYHQNDPDMFGYIVEITGKRGGEVYGNVFEVGDYAEFAAHIRDTALPLESVTLTYSDRFGVNAGKTITVPRLEYDNDRHRLMSKSGSVTAIRFNPSESVQTMSELLQSERSRRMAYPIGSPQAHFDKIAARIAEVRKPPEQEAAAEQNNGDKPAPPRKLTINEKIAAGKQKSEEYLAQKAQNPTKSNNKERN
ncbi:hypothetical protein FACS1894217_10590 [Clostridia bacterium]|nr:hypothetical protein FACS1894217_10590 [Clostridia bacterium]